MSTVSRFPRQQREVEKNVYEMTLERIDDAYRRFDRLVVSFSGGKDSTCVLHCALEVAKSRGKLPLEVVFWDEECIYSRTVQYLERIRQRPDVRLRWLCIPHKHRNACSKREPWWYPWDPTKPELWVRQPPPFAERTAPGFVRPSPFPEQFCLLWDPKVVGTVGMMTGIRAAESLTRRDNVTRRLVDNWISRAPSGGDWLYQLKPVYDWSVEDVWTFPKLKGIDYNECYDDFEKLGVARNNQRCNPPFGEEPLQSLHQYALLDPELWEKMIDRVHGARTAARYARSPVYGHGGGLVRSEVSPEEQIKELLAKWDEKTRAFVADRIAREIRLWNERSHNTPIPIRSEDPHGFSWEFLIRIAQRGDMKGRKRAIRGKEHL